MVDTLIHTFAAVAVVFAGWVIITEVRRAVRWWKEK